MLKGLHVSSWIRVEDRLPATTNDVLGTFVSYGRPGEPSSLEVGIGYYIAGSETLNVPQCWMVGSNRRRVVAWMALPAPFKEELQMSKDGGDKSNMSERPFAKGFVDAVTFDFKNQNFVLSLPDYAGCYVTQADAEIALSAKAKGLQVGLFQRSKGSCPQVKILPRVEVLKSGMVDLISLRQGTVRLMTDKGGAWSADRQSLRIAAQSILDEVEVEIYTEEGLPYKVRRKEEKE